MSTPSDFFDLFTKKAVHGKTLFRCIGRQSFNCSCSGERKYAQRSLVLLKSHHHHYIWNRVAKVIMYPIRSLEQGAPPSHKIHNMDWVVGKQEYCILFSYRQVCQVLVQGWSRVVSPINHNLIRVSGSQLYLCIMFEVQHHVWRAKWSFSG